MGFVESIFVALFLMSVVFFVLFLLYLSIKCFSYFINQIYKK